MAALEDIEPGFLLAGLIPGENVTVNIEITDSAGFSESVVRNVIANAGALRFDDHGFV